MRNAIKRFGLITFVAVIGFSIAACGDDKDGQPTAPVITTTVLPSGTVGTAYSQTLTATGDTPITWSVILNTLPAGLNLAGDTISGNPTTGGTFTFTVKAANAAGTDTKALSIYIIAAPTITNETFPDGKVGNWYLQPLSATGSGTIIWSLESGTLPTGLSINQLPAGIGIFGTPENTGTFTFTIKAANDVGIDTRQFTITIVAVVAPTITATTLPNGTPGTAYYQTLTATGERPITWSLESGSLPTGLSLEVLNTYTSAYTSAVAIAGTPTEANTFPFTVKATNVGGNDTKALSITITTAPTITTTSLPNGTPGTAYSQTIAAIGSTPITWSLVSGSLPTGLTLEETTGAITGTPTEEKTFTFTVRATNATGNNTKALSITINTAPTITTTSLPNGKLWIAYNQKLEATGTTPITWVFVDRGSLPSYWSLVGATGEITGIPDFARTYTFTVEAINAAGSDTRQFSITIPAPPTITTATTLPGGTVGVAYSQTLEATGYAPITWSLDSGDILPWGLSLAETGEISGTPFSGRTYTFTVKATNEAGTTTRQFSITIAAAPATPTISTTSLANGTLGTAYSRTLSATGDTPITWSLDSGTLPTGLSLAASGAITGTPTTAGTFTFTVKATNAVGSNTKALSITIRVAPTITTETLPDGTVGTTYNQTLTATGDTPITWNLVSGGGALPTGLSLAASGEITGTPTTGGEFTFTVRATNAARETTKLLSITIATPPTITTTLLPIGTLGFAYSGTLTATGDTPITWSLESGALPTGLNLAATGTITGTPTAMGRSTFTVKATNAVGNTTKSLSITIIRIEMVPMQSGTFWMGSPDNEPGSGSYLYEERHQVTLTQGFYMGKYPVTQALYQTVMGSNPSAHKVGGTREDKLGVISDTTNFPVEMVSWYDAIVFCNKLSVMDDLSPAYEMQTAANTNVWSNNPDTWGDWVPVNADTRWNSVRVAAGSTGYRLPTEAQWEYACRAGTTAAYNWGTDYIDDTKANYNADSVDANNTVAGTYPERTTEVGSYNPNAWGLYDMHGNVSEWCWDWYRNTTGNPGSVTDPTGPSSGDQSNNKLTRGGSWNNNGARLRSASKIGYGISASNTGGGFRLMLPAQ